MGKKEKEDGAAPEGAAPNRKVRFKVVWSSDLGYFALGREAEIPADVAASLAREGVVEIQAAAPEPEET